MSILFPDNLQPRDIFTDILPFIDEEGIILFTGARQVGKTYLLYLTAHHLLTAGVAPSQIIFFDLENIHDLTLIQELSDYNDFLKVVKDLGADTQNKIYILIDEIQHLKNPSSFLKYLHDHYKPKLKFIVSGSSSLEIKKKFTDQLTGRIYTFAVSPLSFKEFMQFKERGELLKKLPVIDFKRELPSANKFNADEIFSSEDKKTVESLLNEYLIFGGYPAISLRENPTVKKRGLEEIYSLYIRRDIKDLGEIEDTIGYNKVVSLLGYQIGNLVHDQELSLSSGLSRPTIRKYLFLLENTFVLTLLPPFFTNKRTELTKMPKVYFEDVGLRNAVINNFNSLSTRPDSGQLLENFVYSQLTKKDPLKHKVHFWRTQTKNEVDFIWQEDETNYFPIEVKWQDTAKSSLPSGLRSFINKYSPRQAFIIHSGGFNITNYKNTVIYTLPAWSI